MNTAIVDEDSYALKMRLDQISDPHLTHAENPPTIARRLILNVDAHHDDQSGNLNVTSNILLYGNRPGEVETALHAGAREDVLLQTEDGFKIKTRTVKLAQTVLPNSTLSLLF